MRWARRAGGGVVVVWMIGLASLLGREGPDLLERPLAAPLHAVAVEPPEPPPAVEAKVAPGSPSVEAPTSPPPEEAKTPALTEITQGDMTLGGDLLSGAGRFPMLSASYQGLQGFHGYAAAMSALGARFVVVRHRRIVGEIDLADGSVHEGPVVGAYSPRARDYSEEPALARPARRVAEQFGTGAEIMLLVPRSLDAGLFGGIAKKLAAAGPGHAAYREIEGRYERGPGGDLRFRLLAGVLLDGTRVPLSGVFPLTRVGVRG